MQQWYSVGNAAVLLNCRGYSLHCRWNSPQREAIHPEHRKSGTLGLVHPGPPATVLNIFQMLREALVLTLFECAGPTPGLWSPQIRSYSPPTHSHANILFCVSQGQICSGLWFLWEQSVLPAPCTPPLIVETVLTPQVSPLPASVSLGLGRSSFPLPPLSGLELFSE